MNKIDGIEGLRKAIDELRGMTHDPEVAHREEDRIREAVLRHIAGGGVDAREMAALALTTDDINFSRWYA